MMTDDEMEYRNSMALTEMAEDDLSNKISLLERKNRELRGEVLALRHGIEGVIGKCQVVLHTG